MPCKRRYTLFAKLHVRDNRISCRSPWGRDRPSNLILMEAARPFPQLVAASAPSLICVPAQLPRAGGPLYTRGGGAYGSPPSRVHGSASIYGGDNSDLIRQPPIGEVVGAGAVGALAGKVGGKGRVNIENVRCGHVSYLRLLAIALGVALAIGIIPSHFSCCDRAHNCESSKPAHDKWPRVMLRPSRGPTRLFASPSTEANAI